MAIVYYPTRIYKRGDRRPAIDRVMAKRLPQMVAGEQNTTSTALTAVIHSEDNWQIDSIAFTFSSNASARNYSAKIMAGRNVVTNYNDSLWFQVANTLPQNIVMAQGFYNGTELATELQTRLNANAAFIAAGVTFSVAYDSATGQFTITPAGGTARYLNVNTQQAFSASGRSGRESIAGHLFGLNIDTAFAASIVSDTNVYALNIETAIINETGSIVDTHYHDTIHILSLDQAVKIQSNVSSTVVNYVVVYEDLV